ncbi:VanZ family protein [Thermodesulfobacteriota bacterium]
MEKARSWLPIAAYCGLIFFLSSLEKGPDYFTLPFPYADKIGHVVLYSGLGFLVARRLTHKGDLGRRHIYMISFLFCLAYGITDELHQRYVPGRMFEFADILADTIGGLVGAAVHFLVARAPRRYV